MTSLTRLLTAYHAPIDVFDGAVEVNHGARRVSQKEASSGLRCDRPGNRIDMPILKPKAGLIRIAQ